MLVKIENISISSITHLYSSTIPACLFEIRVEISEVGLGMSEF